MLTSPLEQFEVFDLFPNSHLFFSGISGLVVTNSVLFILIPTFLLGVVFNSSLVSHYLIPTKWQQFIESIFVFVINLVKENVTAKFLNNIFSLIFFLFLFLFALNLTGMVPYSFTVTSHFVVTFVLSLSFFIGINIVGVLKHGKKILNLFLPEGAPALLLPVLFVIEFISYFSRVFSLAIRLFANLMSGHTLLKILAGFAWVMFLSLGWGSLASIFPFLIIFLVTGLEIGIGILQAYVFCMLLCLYYRDVIFLH